LQHGAQIVKTNLGNLPLGTPVRLLRAAGTAPPVAQAGSKAQAQ
jgi:hypothetical protein